MQALLGDEARLRSADAVELAQAAINAAEDLIVAGADASNVNVLQGAVTAAVKFFAAKIRGAQRNGSPEAPAETVIGEIPVASYIAGRSSQVIVETSCFAS
ncbi:predicted protein [Histoplasma mississippiense (nom. inval.)]|uniref:predicted protein n=1 Tax=Ajellomyces capsulatus (strain NAm1 / WU24) TaxID=2059318 RepID=UPI000157D2C1|nr:predicted protein [Histoplasma mississippiense (nom. inval.)]EDN04754.1 predicted protein [Histoplasma mississippiense (nom. inval.)]